MPEFKPKKNEVLGIIFSFYCLIVALMLGISANIVYDLYIKPASINLKIGIIICSFILLAGIIYIINEFYIKPFYKQHTKSTPEK